MIQTLKTTLIAVLILTFVSAYAQKTFIHCGNLIDGKSDKIKSQMTVIIENGTIVAVQKGFTPPDAGGQLIDLSNKTVMPGLMDMHVHLEHETNKNRYLERFTLNPADKAFRAYGYARKDLMAGFTTVRDLAGSGVNIALKNAINQGVVEGPRIYTAGRALTITGGHGDPTNGFRLDLMGDPGPEMGIVNGVEDARKAVRQRYKNGADLIKIAATGGVLSVSKDGSGPSFSEEEIQMIVKTASDLGMHVAAHAHGAEGMKRAIRSGVRTIEHGTKMDDEVIALMKQYGTFYVPTVSAGRSVAEYAKIEGYYPPMVRPKALEIGPLIQSTFEKAYKAGVKIAFGTDAAVFPHGENWKEFVYMVEGGMPPMEAIQCATMRAAELLEIDDTLGSVEAGKYADLVAVDQNPLDNIAVMENVTFVMKDGVVYKHL
ncbi:MAG: amidohydrolase family protein [Bacteroidetes bacterium]|nr:amidohydrolase family protein [Bacteroidota bacterium]